MTYKLHIYTPHRSQLFIHKSSDRLAAQLLLCRAQCSSWQPRTRDRLSDLLYSEHTPNRKNVQVHFPSWSARDLITSDSESSEKWRMSASHSQAGRQVTSTWPPHVPINYSTAQNHLVFLWKVIEVLVCVYSPHFLRWRTSQQKSKCWCLGY